MDRNALWKWLVVIGLTAASLALVVPPREKIRLGLDLKGGMSFTVQVDHDAMREQLRIDMEGATESELAQAYTERMRDAQSRALEVLRNRIDNLGIAEPNIYAGKDDRIIIQLPGINEEKRHEAEESLKKLAFLEFRLVHERNDELVSELADKNQAPEGYRWAAAGQERLLVRDRQALSNEQMDEAYRRGFARFGAPSGYEFMLEKIDRQGQIFYRPAFVRIRRELTGDALDDAQVDFRALGQPVVQLRFDARGARAFGQLTADYAPGGARNTSQNVLRQLAIVLDGTLYSAPTIREPIRGGRAEISGSFSLPEANFLANVLRAGSLPAPVKIVERRFVAPSLGADSIRSGVRAMVYGGIAVVVFMAVYYMLSGLIANMALLLNIILLPLGMVLAAGFLGIFARDSAVAGTVQLPVLTLPGLAGILLTLGMAVDANVLIFERIREESGVGKRLWSAITAGYDRAFVTIMDANLTTLLTAVILFIVGSGPIRGFAVTLCAGIMASMFTALVFTRLVFGLLPNRDSNRTLKMLRIIGDTKIDFVGKRTVALVISLSLIIASWGVMIQRGMESPGRIFGVDFTGGAAIALSFDQNNRVETEALRPVLDEHFRDVHLQYQAELDRDGDAYLQVKLGGEAGEADGTAVKVAAVLNEAFPASAFAVEQEDTVGAQVGSELQRRAVWAIVSALLGIIVYLSWRFELGFAIGAIAALTHDVLLTVGLYVLSGRQLSLPIIAALLTIVGYSVNDTIVVFDRIREDLKLVRGGSFKDICNLSINQTLSRTLLTSLTTMLVVGMLLVFGGGAINDFALTLFIGVIVGTYSSVFVATPVVLSWYRNRRPEFGK